VMFLQHIRVISSTQKPSTKDMNGRLTIFYNRMQREVLATPRQRAPQGATNRAQLKSPAVVASSPAPSAHVSTPRNPAPKSLLAAAAEHSATHRPTTVAAYPAISSNAASRPQSTLSRSSSLSSRSSRGGLRPCVQSLTHALKVC
jgi:hypothetical protein